jgi:lipid-binding SYLF domain-containing protein
MAAIVLAAALVTPHATTAADKAAQIAADAQAALTSLCDKEPAAHALQDKALAILVFPKITKAGFIVGGQQGKGALIKHGTAVAYYETTGASVGLQAGAQTYGYALFFMNEKALAQLDAANGFEIGVGPSVVVVDKGAAKDLTTTTMHDDIYAFIFGQQGLMAGIGIQGNKVSKINPK